MIPSIVAAVLSNAVDNSYRNTAAWEAGEEFIPLPDDVDLLSVPTSVSFAKNASPDDAYSHAPQVAETINYEARLASILSNESRQA